MKNTILGVVGIPELHEHICYHLTPHDYVACVQVNKTFCALFLPFLWHTVNLFPSIEDTNTDHFILTSERFLSQDGRTATVRNGHLIKSFKTEDPGLVAVLPATCTNLYRLCIGDRVQFGRSTGVRPSVTPEALATMIRNPGVTRFRMDTIDGNITEFMDVVVGSFPILESLTIGLKNALLLGASAGWKTIKAPYSVNISPLSFKVLLDRSTATLETFVYERSGGIRETEAQQLLTRFENLQNCALDLWCNIAVMIQPPIWTCAKSLVALRVVINMIPRPDIKENHNKRPLGNEPLHQGDSMEESRKLQKQLYARLGSLTRLECLTLGTDFNEYFWAGDPEGHYSNDIGVAVNGYQYECLEFTLASGLGEMAGLKNLVTLDLTRMSHRIRVPELKWMSKNWPRLETIIGLFPQGDTRDPEVEAWLKDNGRVALHSLTIGITTPKLASLVNHSWNFFLEYDTTVVNFPLVQLAKRLNNLETLRLEDQIIDHPQVLARSLECFCPRLVNVDVICTTCLKDETVYSILDASVSGCRFTAAPDSFVIGPKSFDLIVKFSTATLENSSYWDQRVLAEQHVLKLLILFPKLKSYLLNLWRSLADDPLHKGHSMDESHQLQRQVYAHLESLTDLEYLILGTEYTEHPLSEDQDARLACQRDFNKEEFSIGFVNSTNQVEMIPNKDGDIYTPCYVRIIDFPDDGTREILFGKEALTRTLNEREEKLTSAMNEARKKYWDENLFRNLSLPIPDIHLQFEPDRAYGLGKFNSINLQRSYRKFPHSSFFYAEEGIVMVGDEWENVSPRPRLSGGGGSWNATGQCPGPTEVELEYRRKRQEAEHEQKLTVAGLLMKRAKEMAEERLKEKVKFAVVTMPPPTDKPHCIRFQDTRPAPPAEAAVRGGLYPLRVLDQSEAAVLAYEPQIAKAERAMGGRPQTVVFYYLKLTNRDPAAEDFLRLKTVAKYHFYPSVHRRMKVAMARHFYKMYTEGFYFTTDTPREDCDECKWFLDRHASDPKEQAMGFLQYDIEQVTSQSRTWPLDDSENDAKEEWFFVSMTEYVMLTRKEWRDFERAWLKTHFSAMLDRAYEKSRVEVEARPPRINHFLIVDESRFRNRTSLIMREVLGGGAELNELVDPAIERKLGHVISYGAARVADYLTKHSSRHSCK
ncbi:hypothetical protein BGZ82_002438 [Podila clonocystis]|nr:hypothetical protein BGZ82_002438 [Podila clonocystis]